MSGSQSIPKLDAQPVAVDFIDNRLPEFHPAFVRTNSGFDVSVGQYVPLNMPRTAMQDAEPQLVGGHESNPTTNQSMHVPPAISSMAFWDKVLPDAMKILEADAEPKSRHGSEWSIRGLANWDDIYEKLIACRKQYADEKGWTKKVRKGWRKFTENSGPLREALKLVPDIDYITPVRGALEVLLDAAKRASNIRRQVLDGLDRLDSIFEDIELFLTMYPSEDNVVAAGTDLVASILMAVERLIGFYIKHPGKKFFTSVLKGDEYEKDVLGSLEAVSRSSEDLRYQATKADMSQSAANWKLVQKHHKELVEWQAVLGTGLVRVVENQNAHARNLAKVYAAGEERITTEVRGNSSLLNEMMGLLKQYEDKRLDEQNELAALMKEVTSLRGELARSRSPQPRYHPPETVACKITPDDLYDLLGLSDIEIIDAKYVLEMQERLPAGERAKAEQLIMAHQLRQWLLSPTSTELLIQGDFFGGRQMSALSVFCSTFMQALEQNAKFLSLVFFCGMHDDPDDPQAGPCGMMKSIITQLLLQWNFNTSHLHEDVNLSWEEDGEEPDIQDLCSIACWLVHQLPATNTVFFLIEGVKAFETDAYVDDLVNGLSSIMDLTIDDSMLATVKVLVTSPSRTVEVREGFDDDTVLQMAGLESMGQEASQRRLHHQAQASLMRS